MNSREEIRAWEDWKRTDPERHRKGLAAVTAVESNSKSRQQVLSQSGASVHHNASSWDAVQYADWTPAVDRVGVSASLPEDDPEDYFVDEFLEARREGLGDREAAQRAYAIASAKWDTNAYTTAARIVHAVLQCLTKSRLPLLARYAETLVLVIMERLSDESSQAELGRKWGITRAAVSKDVQHIRKHGSFGVICEFLFSNPARRSADVKRAKDTHAKEKKLRECPPENSLAGELQRRLAA